MSPRLPLRRREEQPKRLLAARAVREALISLAGILGRPVRNQVGAEIGPLVDVVAKWEGDIDYPPVTSLVVRVGRRLAFVPIEKVSRFGHDDIQLHSARLDLTDFERREGEVLLARDVLDHQLVDIDGVKVLRAADLYVAPVHGVVRLVGVDVGLHTLLRRLGPRRWRTRSTPERVLDWAGIQPFGAPTGQVHLRSSQAGLRRLRPGELADLLEALGRSARRELLSVLEPETAADALEEMQPRELNALLRESPPEEAAALVARMEPDEAVEALRELEEEERAELLGRMPGAHARRLRHLLGYPSEQAGGLMTTNLVLVRATEDVASIRERLRAQTEHRSDIDAVIVVDADGKLVDDITLFELFLAEPAQRISELVGSPPPVTITAGEPALEVAELLIEGRGSSLVVVDENGRPVGRILADDVLDIFFPNAPRTGFPRLFE